MKTNRVGLYVAFLYLCILLFMVSTIIDYALNNAVASLNNTRTALNIKRIRSYKSLPLLSPGLPTIWNLNVGTTSGERIVVELKTGNVTFTGLDPNSASRLFWETLERCRMAEPPQGYISIDRHPEDRALNMGMIGDSRDYFADIRVIETVTRKPFTVNEVMEMLDKLPNVKTVMLPSDPRVPFSIYRLAYPQYRSDFQLTKSEWKALQDLCRKNLKQGIACDEVLAHWRSIVAGTPPFGLTVGDR